MVTGWGGRPLVVWEAPPSWTVEPKQPDLQAPLHVLYIGVFSDDEPIEVVLGAAAELGDVEINVTGDPGKAPAGLVQGAPAAVAFTGYLRGEHYVAALAWADVIVSLTTEPTSVMRAACEAVWARRALVVTDSAAARHAFPFAHHVANEPAELAELLRGAAGWSDATVEAYAFQAEAWRNQCEELRRRLEVAPASS